MPKVIKGFISHLSNYLRLFPQALFWTAVAAPQKWKYEKIQKL
jgi:hypothetical protein